MLLFMNVHFTEVCCTRKRNCDSESLSMLKRAGGGCRHFARNISLTKSNYSASLICLALHPRSQHALATQTRDPAHNESPSPTRPASGPPMTPAPRLHPKDFARLLERPPQGLLAFLEEPVEKLTRRELLQRIHTVFKKHDPRGHSASVVFRHTRQLADFCERLLDMQARHKEARPCATVYDFCTCYPV